MKRKTIGIISIILAIILLASTVAAAAGTKLFYKGETQISDYRKIEITELD